MSMIYPALASQETFHAAVYGPLDETAPEFDDGFHSGRIEFDHGRVDIITDEGNFDLSLELRKFCDTFFTGMMERCSYSTNPAYIKIEMEVRKEVDLPGYKKVYEVALKRFVAVLKENSQDGEVIAHGVKCIFDPIRPPILPAAGTIPMHMEDAPADRLIESCRETFASQTSPLLDCKVTFKEGHLMAHRIVLASQSPALKTGLESAFAETDFFHIEASPAAGTALLGYIYRDTKPVYDDDDKDITPPPLKDHSLEITIELIHLANLYLMHDLLREAVNHLCVTHLTTDNVLGIAPSIALLFHELTDEDRERPFHESAEDPETRRKFALCQLERRLHLVATFSAPAGGAGADGE